MVTSSEETHTQAAKSGNKSNTDLKTALSWETAHTVVDYTARKKKDRGDIIIQTLKEPAACIQGVAGAGYLKGEGTWTYTEEGMMQKGSKDVRLSQKI